jgi:Ca2+-binding RTX toxin-like protein
MILSKAIRIAAPLTGVAAALLMAGPAAAAPSNPFGCRASVEAARPSAGLPGAEPYVANPAETPCATDSAGAGTTGSGMAGSSAPGAAYTVSDVSVPAATALASVNGGTSNGTGNSVVLSSPAQAQASFACVNGSAVPSGSSNVTGALINGQMVHPASPGAETTTQMGGGSYTTINQQVQTSTSLIERAVFTHIAGVGDYVLGEAQVTRPAADPCPGSGGSGSGSGGTGSTGGGSGGSAGSGGSGGPGGSGGDGALSACPTGSVLVASAQMCEIVSADGSQNIVVSKPFAGPTGGTVVPLAAARQKIKSSCLSGKGPKFVVMGTNKANTIRAGKAAERIVAMGGNDKVIVKRGNSCVDGGAGRDTISGGSGKVRLFGGAGNDKMTAGNGASYVSGGTGADTVTVGRGKDHLFGGAGNDRLRAAGRVEYVNGGAGKDVAYVTAKEMKYAHRHGCETVHRIRVKR